METKECVKKHNYRFIKLKNKESINCSGLELFYYGIHYKINKNYNNMVKYWLMAIDKGYSNAIFHLGLHYKNIYDIDNMLKYYLMAIEKGDVRAMHNLGLYYQKYGDYNNMMKYYLIAIENGCTYTIHNLVSYCKENDNDDYENIMKYFLMGIRKRHNECIDKIIAWLDKLKLSSIRYSLKYYQWFTDEQLEYLKKVKYIIKRPFKCMPSDNNFKDVIIICHNNQKN